MEATLPSADLSVDQVSAAVSKLSTAILERERHNFQEPVKRPDSRGRLGYGFRPTSGAATPHSPEPPHSIEGQNRPAAVVDQNGLGWPGTYTCLPILVS
jgi:hypothetical protein